MMLFLTACSAQFGPICRLFAGARFLQRSQKHYRDINIKCQSGIPPAGKGHGGLAEKEAVGISAEIEQEDGSVMAIDVQAPAVICAGNAIATPVLLLKSGIDGRGQVGAHLHAHPIAGVRAVFPEVSWGLIPRLHAQCFDCAGSLGLA